MGGVVNGNPPVRAERGVAMAHTCPECGQMCHCGSDIDDCLFDFDDDVDNCTHCDGRDDENCPDEAQP